MLHVLFSRTVLQLVTRIAEKQNTTRFSAIQTNQFYTLNYSVKASTDFLNSIGHTDKVYIRCLSPKNTPLPELEARGMTYKDKSDKTKKSTVNGYIDLQTGIFYRRYGKEYKPVIDGWGHLQELNQQGYGIYFVVGHGGERNSEITHGSTLFHESDRASFDDQQLEIDRITQQFGKPTAVVKTKKSLHAYWASSETISIETLPTIQRCWLQFSNCDDSSLADPSQLMRLPGFDHLAWNGTDFDRVQCELIQLNDVSYSLAEFDRVLPALDVDRYCQLSLELVESNADDRDMRSIAQYLPGFDSSGKWIKAKCPAHDGESSDSLHIDADTGGFVCHGGCSSSAVYNAAKAVAVANGHRFEVVNDDDLDRAVVDRKLDVIGTDFQLSKLFPSSIATPLAEYCQGTAVPQGLMSMALITCLATLVHPKTHLKCFGNTLRIAKPIFWLCIYGVSGNGKTHSYAPVLNALKKLGEEHNLVHEQALEEWNEIQRQAKRGKAKDIDPQILEQANQPPPDRQRYWVGDVTIEALLSRCSKQKERGLLLYSPELLGWCLRMNPEKGELEYHLSLWDGDSVEGERIGREFTPVANPSVSVMGGVQPDVMAKLVAKGEEIQNGFMPRMALVRFEEVPKPPLSKGSPINFSVMNTLFKAVADTGEPMEVSLHPECFDTSDSWDREMDNLRLAETRKSIKPLYPKFNGYSYRIALMLHIINRALDPTQPDEVPLSTFTAAIEFTRWLVSQSVSIYEELLGDEQEDTIAKFLNSTKYTGWMSVRQFHKPNWRKFKTADEARKTIEKMIELGYVEGNGEKLTNKKFKFKYVDTEKRGQVDKTDETYTSKPFNSSTANVDGVDIKPRTDDISMVSADKKSVDKIEGDRISNGGQNLDPLDLQQVDTSLSTEDLEPLTDDTLMVSADINRNCPQPYTRAVDGLKPFAEGDSAVLSTCPQDLNVHKYKSPLKIGDRAKLGGEFFIVDKIEDDFIGGKSDDGSYIGGYADSVQFVNIPPPTTNRMVELVRQEQIKTIDAGEIEYEC
jgi:Protein of unknown function (DUF3987)